MLLALTSAAGASKTGFLDIWYLIKHSSGYTFHFGKNTKTSKRSKPKDPDLYLERTKEIQGQNSQFLLSFVKPHGPVSNPTISRWIMIVLNLSGIDAKTFTGHSTRTAFQFKD